MGSKSITQDEFSDDVLTVWPVKLNGLEGEINQAESRVKILIIPTNEELEIARETLAVLKANGAA
jgi:acetate kinase